MSSIVTVTFNPCIDKSISVPNLVPEKKLRCHHGLSEPGGGGINVARAIRKLNGDVTAIYFAGGPQGKLLTELLRKNDVPVMPIEIKNDTRENWMILENSTNRQYRFIMPGPVIDETEWKECLKAVESIDEKTSFIVISGSNCDGIPNDMISGIGEIAKRKNIKLVVDTSGEALKHAVQYGVYMIKPSLNELSSLIVSLDLDDRSATAAAQDIIARGYCEVIAVSLGAAGAILVTKDIVKEIKTPPVKTKSTVGAGDSMVAGIVLSLAKKRSFEEAIKYGVACGTATTMNPGTELFHPDDVETLYALMQKKSTINLM